ncbi:PilZ domain-containing protein [Caulobacter sp. KR2-114]|uniref:PilZ domain-containing protein n=1 Tax=Caulobacter sp. KR2-114 TaxID=3400912 RepID=UPI003C0A0ECE
MSRVAVSANPADRRTLERVPTALRAKVFPGSIDCVIRDYNDRGARLEFSQPIVMGEQIVVVIWSSGLAYESVIRWRGGAQVGVQFQVGRDLRRPTPAHFAAIRSEWMNRRPRLSRRKLAKCAAMIDDRAARRGAWKPV